MWHCKSASQYLTEIAWPDSLFLSFFFFLLLFSFLTFSLQNGQQENNLRLTGSFSATCVPVCVCVDPIVCAVQLQGENGDAIRKWCRELTASNVTAPLIRAAFEKRWYGWSVVICYVLYNLNQTWYLTSASFQWRNEKGRMVGWWGRVQGMFPQTSDIGALAPLASPAWMSTWIKSQRGSNRTRVKSQSPEPRLMIQLCKRTHAIQPQQYENCFRMDETDREGKKRT